MVPQSPQMSSSDTVAAGGTGAAPMGTAEPADGNTALPLETSAAAWWPATASGSADAAESAALLATTRCKLSRSALLHDKTQQRPR